MVKNLKFQSKQAMFLKLIDILKNRIPVNRVYNMKNTLLEYFNLCSLYNSITQVSMIGGIPYGKVNKDLRMSCILLTTSIDSK